MSLKEHSPFEIFCGPVSVKNESFLIHCVFNQLLSFEKIPLSRQTYREEKV